MAPFLQWTREQRRFWRRTLRTWWALYAINAAALLANAAIIGRNIGMERYGAAMIQLAPVLISLWALSTTHTSIKRARQRLRGLIQLVQEARQKLRFLRRVMRMNASVLAVSTIKLDGEP